MRSVHSGPAVALLAKDRAGGVSGHGSSAARSGIVSGRASAYLSPVLVIPRIRAMAARRHPGARRRRLGVRLATAVDGERGHGRMRSGERVHENRPLSVGRARPARRQSRCGPCPSCASGHPALPLDSSRRYDGHFATTSQRRPASTTLQDFEDRALAAPAPGHFIPLPSLRGLAAHAGRLAGALVGDHAVGSSTPARAPDADLPRKDSGDKPTLLLPEPEPPRRRHQSLARRSHERR